MGKGDINKKANCNECTVHNMNQENCKILNLSLVNKGYQKTKVRYILGNTDIKTTKTTATKTNQAVCTGKLEPLKGIINNIMAYNHIV